MRCPSPYLLSWRKFGAPAFDLPKTDSILSFGYDLKMPPYFEDTDFVQIGKIIAYAANIASGTVVSLGAAVDEASSEHLIETTYFKEQEDTKEFLEDNLKVLNREK